MADGSGPIGGLTPKQEAFVHAYLETSNATEAYRRAYDAKKMSENALNVEAHRVLNHPKVTLRLRVLQERTAAKVTLTRSWVLEQLMDNVTKAKQADDYNASNKALELLGKTDEIGGMFIERQNVQSDNRHHHSAEPVSPFNEFLTGAAGPRAKEPPADPLQN
jgi:phage terminase small subunit